MIHKRILPILVIVASAPAYATSYDEAINICSTVAAITQEALEDMHKRRVPLEKTVIYGQVAHDPNLVKALQNAVTLNKRGIAIPQVVGAWAQGCMQALTVGNTTTASGPARGTRISR